MHQPGPAPGPASASPPAPRTALTRPGPARRSVGTPGHARRGVGGTGRPARDTPTVSTPPAGTAAARRLLCAAASAQALEPLPLDPATVRAGTPLASSAELTDDSGPGVGIWELTPGTVTDVESDEVFVVLAGRGTVTFSDGSAIALRPGTVARLRAGDATVWEVTETVRKVYLA